MQEVPIHSAQMGTDNANVQLAKLSTNLKTVLADVGLIFLTELYLHMLFDNAIMRQPYANCLMTIGLAMRRDVSPSVRHPNKHNRSCW